MKIFFGILIIIVLLLVLFLVRGSKQAVRTNLENKDKSYYFGLEKIELRVGESKNIDNRTIKLLEVRDSRCPKGATCIQAGEAIALYEITSDKKTENFELKLTGEVDLAEFPDWEQSPNIKRFMVPLSLTPESVIYLISVLPYPSLEQSKGEQVATLIYEDRESSEKLSRVFELANKKLKSRTELDGPIYKVVQMYPFGASRKVWFIEYAKGLNVLEDSERIKFEVDLEGQTVKEVR